MIDPKIVAALNSQINQELTASYVYLAMSAYFEARSLPGFAKWMQGQSDEEQAHAQRLFRYLLDRGGRIELEAIAKPPSGFDSVRAVLDLSLEQEEANTRAIHKLYGLARELDDYATLSHLQWFLDEQVEEEKLFGDVIGRLELAKDDASALLILDQELASGAFGGGDQA